MSDTRRRCCRVSEASRHNRLSPPMRAARIKSTPSPGSKVLVAKVSHAAKRRFTRVALPKGMLVAWQYSGGRFVSRVSTLGLGGLFIAAAFIQMGQVANAGTPDAAWYEKHKL